MIKRIAFLLTIFLFFFQSNYQSQAQSVFLAGEEIEYEVSFLGIKLGSIKIITEGAQKLNGKDIYKAKAFIKSYEGIPFVGLQTTYESWIDKSLSYSHKFIGNSKFLSDAWTYQELIFDYDNNKIRDSKWENKQPMGVLEFATKKKWNDGLSLFFLARQFTDSKKNIRIPTYMGDDTAHTSINFSGKREAIEIDAVKYPIRTILFNGQANWEGVYGLSGKFEGWFSDDEARVPIKAKMKVLVGNVNIELVRWKRNGWTPPK